MSGGSQSILVQCSDEKYYVVKMSNNPQGGNTLANETLGSVVVGAVGLPTTTNRIIYISDNFIDSEPALFFDLQFGKQRPSAGIHFGSLFIGQISGLNRPMDYIGRSRIHLIANRHVFLGMYILDSWANHQDHRQAILLKNPDNTQEAVFIDHGLMFGGRSWSFNDQPGVSLHLERNVYKGLWREEVVDAWISHFRKVLPDVLRSAVSIVPSRWYNGDVDNLVKKLLHRLQSLDELVRADAVKLRWFLLHHSENDILRLSDHGVHKLRTPDRWNTFHRELAALRTSFLFADELRLERVED